MMPFWKALGPAAHQPPANVPNLCQTQSSADITLTRGTWPAVVQMWLLPQHRSHAWHMLLASD